nr:MAG TPA: hypothetical protein [Caudoviricetes sp.]
MSRFPPQNKERTESEKTRGVLLTQREALCTSADLVKVVK